MALLDHDDVLPAHALYMIAEPSCSASGRRYHLFRRGQDRRRKAERYDPHFKSDCEPGPAARAEHDEPSGRATGAELVQSVGGFRDGLRRQPGLRSGPARDRGGPARARIRHIPIILYHWRVFETLRPPYQPQLTLHARRRRRAVRWPSISQRCGIRARSNRRGVTGRYNRVAAWPLPGSGTAGLPDRADARQGRNCCAAASKRSAPQDRLSRLSRS